jgi:hypothetical protein
MTNEQTMKLMEELGLHDGGVDNWYSDNADSEDRSEFTRPDAEDCAAAIRARGQV